MNSYHEHKTEWKCSKKVVKESVIKCAALDLAVTLCEILFLRSIVCVDYILSNE